MDVDRRAFCGLDSQAHFNVRKNQANATQTAAVLFFKNLFIGVNAVIVGDTKRSDGRVGFFNAGEKVFPRICTFVLVAQNGAGRMNVLFPSIPERSALVSRVCIWCHASSLRQLTRTVFLAAPCEPARQYSRV